MTPTPDDLVRDPVADMAVCDAAESAPWSVDHFDRAGIEGYYVGSGEDRVCVAWYESDGEKFTDEEDPVQVQADLAFIALARTALPAWIRRARAAEDDNLFRRSQIQDLENEVSILKDAKAAAEAEVARLRSALSAVSREADEADPDASLSRIRSLAESALEGT